MEHYASQCPETLEDTQRMLEENTETGKNMLHHATMDEQPTQPTDEMLEQPTQPTDEMLFASPNITDMEDNDTLFIFAQDVRNVETQHGGRLPPEWILLDNQSTVDVFTN